MPVVIVEWWEGRTSQQKKKLMEDLYAAFGKNGVKKESLQIIIHDVPKTNWAKDGKQSSESLT